MSSSQESPAKCWDFTTFIPQPIVDEYEQGVLPWSEFEPFHSYIMMVKGVLDSYSDDWVFQLEKAPTTGSYHLQGRMRLKKKSRLTAIVKLFKTTLLSGTHYSKTSATNIKNDFYVTKLETRCDGPWFRHPERVSGDIKTSIDKLYQISHINDDTLYPWQKKMYQIMGVKDPRTIHCLIDLSGNSGKSVFTSYSAVLKTGCIAVPPLDSYKDICQFLCSFIEQRGIDCAERLIIDFPRSLRQDSLYQFMSGIEQIKNGCVYDTRYKARQVVFPSPQILLFMNTIPEPTYVSLDRWSFWTIIDKDLVPIPVDVTGPPADVKTNIYNWLNTYAPAKSNKSNSFDHLNRYSDILGRKFDYDKPPSYVPPEPVISSPKRAGKTLPPPPPQYVSASPPLESSKPMSFRDMCSLSI